MTRPPKSMPADERKAATIQAVVALAGEQHPQAITTQAIADRMGVTQGALFRHFPSKDAILEGVVAWIAEHLLKRLDNAAQSAPTTLAALEAMFESHIAFISEHPGVPRMLFGELQHPKPTPAKRMARNLIEGYSLRLNVLLRQGIERGELDPTLDTQDAAALFIGTIQGLAMQSMMIDDVGHMQRRAAGTFRILRNGFESRKA